ncbi:MAG: N-acetylmuramoyl-L-alanine amidase [Pseudomonadota bacterium]
MVLRLLGTLVLMWCAGAMTLLAGEARFAGNDGGLLGPVTVRLTVPPQAAHRVFLRKEPPRLVVDVEAGDTVTGPDPEKPLTRAQVSPLGDGWSRFVFTLNGPHVVRTVAVDAGGAMMVRIARASHSAFEKAVAGAPAEGLTQALLDTPEVAPQKKVRIALDPGHGGVDPGAIRHGVVEKDIVLAMGLELADLLEATGRYDVIMTRRSDVFVALDDRVAFARARGARLFLSIHANTVTKGSASGAAVYVPARIASDPESAALALLENRADEVGAVNPVQVTQPDIARTLMDMTRRTTVERARGLAAEIIGAVSRSTGVLRSRPLRAADFRVLRAPDMPSILLEIGFLTHPEDRRNMQSSAWRARLATSVSEAIDAWTEADAAYLALMQQ